MKMYQSRFTRETEPIIYIYIYIYIYLPTYLYLYISICVDIYIYIYRQVGRQIGRQYVYTCIYSYIYLYLYIERERLTYYEELAHTITEAEKSHNLPSASWRPRKADDVVQWESEGQRTRRVCALSPSLGAGEMGVPALQSGRRGKFLSHPTLFYPAVCMMLIHVGGRGQSALLSPLIRMMMSSRTILTDTPRNNIQPNIWAPHIPVKWIYITKGKWPIKL